MPNFTATTTIQTPKETLRASSSGDYDEVFRMTLEAPFGTSTTGTFMEAIQTHTVTGAGYARDLKYLLVKNIGNSALELHFTIESWTDSAPDGNGAESYLRFLIPAGDYMLLPNIRMVDWNTEATGAAAGILSDANGKTPDTNLYEALDVIATGTPQLIDESGDLSADDTSITVDDSTFFYVGDLIQLETEIIEIVGIFSGTTIRVNRGVYGSTAATHIDDTAIRLPFFNAYHDYGDTTINGGGDGSSALCKTDSLGRFKMFNMIGFARDANYDADGIVPGSFAIQFRTEGGYQELGLTGITSSTNSGLTASTLYGINITVDGGTEFADLSFTTDSSNLNFGGTNGVIQKIQDALNTQYYTSGNLFERKVTVGIVNGDIRFSSASNRSGSAISLASPAGAGGETNFFGNGRIPAIGNIKPAVAARFPKLYKDTKGLSPVTGSSSNLIRLAKDTSSIAWDDGNGNINGAATGTIHYGSGAIDIQNAPPNADFIVWFNYGAALGGGIKTTDAACNAIKDFRFRGVNYQVDAKIEFIGMN